MQLKLRQPLYQDDNSGYPKCIGRDRVDGIVVPDVRETIGNRPQA